MNLFTFARNIDFVRAIKELLMHALWLLAVLFILSCGSQDIIRTGDVSHGMHVIGGSIIVTLGIYVQLRKTFFRENDW